MNIRMVSFAAIIALLSSLSLVSYAMEPCKIHESLFEEISPIFLDRDRWIDMTIARIEMLQHTLAANGKNARAFEQLLKAHPNDWAAHEHLADCVQLIDFTLDHMHDLYNGMNLTEDDRLSSLAKSILRNILRYGRPA